jgi:hypothetical protein
MKIRFVHEIVKDEIAIGDEVEVSESVGLARIAGGYAVDITKPLAPKVNNVKVKYVRDVTSPPSQVGKVGDVKEIDIVVAKHLIAEGYVKEFIELKKTEKEKTNEPIIEETNTGNTGHKKRTRKRP